jgi:hypothetical protein
MNYLMFLDTHCSQAPQFLRTCSLFRYLSYQKVDMIGVQLSLKV